MRKPLMAALAATLMLGACGGTSSSRLNPFKWFRGSGQTEAGDTLAPKGGYPVPVADRAPLVARVIAMKVDRNPGGVIVRATGLPPTQGYWDGKLVTTNDGQPDDKGVMTYRFVLVPPPAPHPASTRQSREVTVAAYLTDIQLQRIRRIVIEGETNSLSARR